MTTPDTDAPDWRETHWFIGGNSRCQHCGMSLQDVRAEGQTLMLTEAFDRLAAVLEKLEAKL